MIIDESNVKFISSREFYVHDDTLVFMNFDRISKTMTLRFSKYTNNTQVYDIRFLNVIGFEMTACDFWGASECVLDFECVDKKDRTVIPKLQKMWDSIADLSDKKYENYIESLFTFTSGDKLKIACETIEIER